MKPYVGLQFYVPSTRWKFEVTSISRGWVVNTGIEFEGKPTRGTRFYYPYKKWVEHSTSGKWEFELTITNKAFTGHNRETYEQRNRFVVLHFENERVVYNGHIVTVTGTVMQYAEVVDKAGIEGHRTVFGLMDWETASQIALGRRKYLNDDDFVQVGTGRVPDFVGRRFKAAASNEVFTIVPEIEVTSPHGSVGAVTQTYRSLYFKSGKSYRLGTEDAVKLRIKNLTEVPLG